MLRLRAPKGVNQSIKNGHGRKQTRNSLRSNQCSSRRLCSSLLHLSARVRRFVGWKLDSTENEDWSIMERRATKEPNSSPCKLSIIATNVSRFGVDCRSPSPMTHKGRASWRSLSSSRPGHLIFLPYMNRLKCSALRHCRGCIPPQTILPAWTCRIPDWSSALATSGSVRPSRNKTRSTGGARESRPLRSSPTIDSVGLLAPERGVDSFSALLRALRSVSCRIER